MDELLRQFLIEGRELVSEAYRALQILGRDPADREALDTAFRAFHTLKGSVAIFDLRPAELVLHTAEDVLAGARNARRHLGSRDVASLTASIDQLDRWIDRLERRNDLGPDAGELADALRLRLMGGDQSGAADPAFRDGIQEAAPGNLIAFRYAPDPDCFFRGEDPLGVVAAVPQLVSVALTPVEPWPELATLDPFRCGIVIEGQSAAPLDEVRAAFRLVPDEVMFRHTDETASDQKAADQKASAEASPGPETEPAAGAGVRVLRVDPGRLDRLGEDIGELLVAANSLSGLAAEAEARDRDLAASIRLAHVGIERATERIRRTAATLRQVSLGPSLRRLPRLVRDIVDELGKPIRFDMRGEDTEVDKDVADGLFEPLLHLARNAIDHGIEPPADRAASGKPHQGHLALDFSRDDRELVVTFEDDGSGIDPERIRAAALRRGLIDPEQARDLTPLQLQHLIFAPGFSTAAAVTDISGRGIGMAAVRAAVDRLGGRLQLHSDIGKGTRIELRFPVHAMTTRLLVVTINRQRYAVPVEHIREMVRLGQECVVDLGNGRACVLHDRTVPVLSLANLLGEVDDKPEPSETRLLVTELDGGSIALQVDDFEEILDGLVRARTGLLAAVNGIQGTTLLPDGGVLLVLRLRELIG